MKVLAHILLEDGRSQEAIASAAGVSSSHLSDVKLGRGEFSLEAAAAVAKVLGVSWELLQLEFSRDDIIFLAKLRRKTER